MLIALCWTISVMLLFREPMSSSYPSAANLFLARVETSYSLVQSFGCQSTHVLLSLFRSFLLSTLVPSVIQPNTILWSLAILNQYVSHDVYCFYKASQCIIYGPEYICLHLWHRSCLPTSLLCNFSHSQFKQIFKLYHCVDLGFRGFSRQGPNQ